MSVHDAPPPAAEIDVDAPPDAADGPARRSWRPAGKLLLEAALIVLSVLLGFAVNAWQQRANDRDLGHRVIANFRREITQNLATVERSYPRHRAFAERLKAAAGQPHPDSSAFEVFASQMPEDGLDLAPLQDAAWETAQSTGALRLLDYETAAQLSSTYSIQRNTLKATLGLISDRFLSPANFDPAQQRVMLMTSHMLLNELSGQESYLIEIYRKTLHQLPGSTDGTDSAHAAPPGAPARR